DPAERGVDAAQDAGDLPVGGRRRDERPRRGAAATELGKRIGRGDGEQVGDVARGRGEVSRDRGRAPGVAGLRVPERADRERLLMDAAGVLDLRLEFLDRLL